jgi:ABC-type transporter Mla MlaB component
MDHSRVTVDCAAFQRPDLATVDALLRLRLMLKRAGEDVVLENSGPRLRELITLIGVQEALESAPSVKPGRETEERE